MLIAVVSDVVWQALIAGVVTIVLAEMSRRTRQSVDSSKNDASKDASKAAKKVEEVKTTLVDATKEVAINLAKSVEDSNKKFTDLTKIAINTQKQGDAIHTLVNSNMGIQLKISAVALRRIANMTKHSEDIEAAVVAEKALLEHDKKQAVVDKKVN